MPTRRSDEGRVSAEISLAFGHGDCRLLRNNVGGLYAKDGRFVAYGLGSMGGKILPGTLDWIGWRKVKITKEMVGMDVAVFATIDAKDRAKPTKEQIIFSQQVIDAGGLAGFAHNVEEARAILYPHWLPPV